MVLNILNRLIKNSYNSWNAMYYDDKCEPDILNYNLLYYFYRY